MRYLVSARKLGDAWQFRMQTPAVLVGKTDPRKGTTFGTTIKRGLGTKHLPTARKLRDELIGYIRGLERQAAANPIATLDDDMAGRWRQAIADHEASSDGGPDEPDVRGIAMDMAEQAVERHRGDPAVIRQAARFVALAVQPGVTLAEALGGYLEARAEGNRSGFKPLKTASVAGVRTALGLLAEFTDKPMDETKLADISAEDAHRFRTTFLPERKTRRAPNGLAHKTVEKHVTLLAGLWAWAIETRKVAGPNPWDAPTRLVPRSRATRGRDQDRELFQPEETRKLLAGLPRGSRMGDAFRLALVTGCRIDEITKLRTDALVLDAGGEAIGFRVLKGKTENAARFVPVPAIARGLLTRTPEAGTRRQEARRRREARDEADGAGRLFPEFPVRPASDKAAAASQQFTRDRRRILGAETDGRLTLHSTRHTWRTMARREGVAEATVDELGGWAGPRRSSSPYDHGLRQDQLSEAQEKIAAGLERSGYLIGY